MVEKRSYLRCDYHTGDALIKTAALPKTEQTWSRGVSFRGVNSWTLWCLEFPNTVWILHFWENSSTSNALSLKAGEPGRDRLTDACGPQSEGNFSGVFPEAEFQLKDLLWRKAKLPYFLSHLELRHRCEKDRFASINTSCCVKSSISFLSRGRGSHLMWRSRFSNEVILLWKNHLLHTNSDKSKDDLLIPGVA